MDRDNRTRTGAKDRLALKPYRGKPAVRNFREGDGDGGIMRSPLHAIALPDPPPGARAARGLGGRSRRGKWRRSHRRRANSPGVSSLTHRVGLATARRPRDGAPPRRRQGVWTTGPNDLGEAALVWKQARGRTCREKTPWRHICLKPPRAMQAVAVVQ